MIFPIITYGDPILRRKAIPIQQGTMVNELVQGMFSTMEQAQGIGLAAPQVGKSARLFVIDLTHHPHMNDADQGFKQVYINPMLEVDESVPFTMSEEGCLSVPDVIIAVPRREKITISYFDMQWEWHRETCSGFLARVLQHEYDHLEGRLHVDHASPLRRRLLRKKLLEMIQRKAMPPTLRKR